MKNAKVKQYNENKETKIMFVTYAHSPQIFAKAQRKLNMTKDF